MATFPGSFWAPPLKSLDCLNQNMVHVQQYINLKVPSMAFLMHRKRGHLFSATLINVQVYWKSINSVINIKARWISEGLISGCVSPSKFCVLTEGMFQLMAFLKLHLIVFICPIRKDPILQKMTSHINVSWSVNFR